MTSFVTPKPEHLHLAQQLWGFDCGSPESSPRLIRQVENFVYEIKINTISFVLRLSSAKSRSFDRIQAELDWVSSLGDLGLNVARPVKSLQNKFVELLQHGDDSYFAAVFRYALGQPLDRSKEIPLRVVSSWGKMLGEFHQAARHYTPSSAKVRRPDWRKDVILQTLEAAMGAGQIPASDELTKAHVWLNGLSTTQETFGLIHCDFHGGNFFVNPDSSLCVFDFDDSCYHWFLYDIAVAVMSVAYTQHSVGKPLAFETIYAEFMKSYLQTEGAKPHSFSEFEKFLRYRILLCRLWGTVYKLRPGLTEAELEGNTHFDTWARAYLDSN